MPLRTARPAVTLLVALTLIAALISLSGCGDPEAELVEQTLVNLRQASAAGDAKTIISLLNDRTITFYDDVVRHAGRSGKAELLKQDPVMVLLALTIRTGTDAKTLRGLTVTKLIEKMVNDGEWGFTFDAPDVKLGRASVSGGGSKIPMQEVVETRRSFSFSRRGRRANSLGRLFASGPTTYYIRFVKQDGTWKLDETTTFDLENEQINKLIRDQSVGGLEGFIRDVFADEDGKPPAATIWNPPIATASKPAAR